MECQKDIMEKIQNMNIDEPDPNHKKNLNSDSPDWKLVVNGKQKKIKKRECNLLSCKFCNEDWLPPRPKKKFRKMTTIK